MIVNLIIAAAIIAIIATIAVAVRQHGYAQLWASLLSEGDYYRCREEGRRQFVQMMHIPDGWSGTRTATFLDPNYYYRESPHYVATSTFRNGELVKVETNGRWRAANMAAAYTFEKFGQTPRDYDWLSMWYPGGDSCWTDEELQRGAEDPYLRMVSRLKQVDTFRREVYRAQKLQELERCL